MERGKSRRVQTKKSFQIKTMIIAGIQKQSLIEYPGKISCVVFLAGCNLRCPFCYVPGLVLQERIKKIRPIKAEEVFSFLKNRKKFLDAVVLTGGEPLINKEIFDFIGKIKKLGYLTGLETNGTNPKLLEKLIKEKLIDYVMLDIKQELVFEKYKKICGDVLTKEQYNNILKSVKLLLSSNVDHEFRTTIMKEFHTEKEILNICKKIKKARVYYLQNYQKKETISGLDFTPFEEKEIEMIVEKGKKYCNIKFRKYF